MFAVLRHGRKRKSSCAQTCALSLCEVCLVKYFNNKSSIIWKYIYFRWNKAVGYCQGFNMLAALILEVMDRSESDSLKVRK